VVNTNNRIEGRSLTEHPLAQTAQPALYSKVGTVLVVEAPISGVILTPEGEMRYQAGDFILTDNPPTHAWPVQAQTFRNTYRAVNYGAIDERGPVSSAVSEPVIEKRARTVRRKPVSRAKKPVPTRQSFKPGVKTDKGVPGKDMAAVADSESLEALT
jgi:hypothetical protein